MSDNAARILGVAFIRGCFMIAQGLLNMGTGNNQWVSKENEYFSVQLYVFLLSILKAKTLKPYTTSVQGFFGFLQENYLNPVLKIKLDSEAFLWYNSTARPWASKTHGQQF